MRPTQWGTVDRLAAHSHQRRHDGGMADGWTSFGCVSRRDETNGEANSSEIACIVKAVSNLDDLL
jgi:hypothetical protein